MTMQLPSALCASAYAECPSGDQICVRGDHPEAGGLHYNRAGFAWDDEEAAESAARVATGG
jgi:hypothetical protein